MRKILPVIVFLSFGVISLFAQLKNSLTSNAGLDESISVLNQNKVELKTISSENSIFALYAKRSIAFQQQNANNLSMMVLDSVVTKDSIDNYFRKEVHFRDGNERDTLVAQYIWNSSTLEWDLNQKNQLTHDSKGNITSSTTFTIFGGFAMGTSKFEASYNANNQQTVNTTYTWNFITSSWVASTKTESTYNASGKETLNMNYTWVSATSSWKSSGKSEYSYDGNGYLILNIDYKLNNNTNLLDNDSKYVFSNDAAGRDTLSTEYAWNFITSSWDLNGKTVTTYNGTNRMPATVVSYQWNINTSSWEGQFKALYSFDTNTNLTSFIFYDWDNDLSTWVGFSKSDFLYDTNKNLSVETSYRWYVDTWSKQSVSNYYYSPSKFTGLNAIIGDGIKVYPNPASDFLYINNLAKSESVSIVTIDGKFVYSRQLVENVIDVTKFKTGIYFLTINTDSGKYTYKFVKK